MSQELEKIKLDPKKVEGKKINERVKVEVIAEEHPFLEKGAQLSIHPIEAERFVKMKIAKRL